MLNGLQSSGTDSEALIAPVVRDSDKPALDCSPRRPIGTVSGPARGSLTQPRRRPGGPLAGSCQYPVARARVSGPRTGYIAKRGLVLSRGREDFSTQSRICLGSRARTWQIANHKRRRGGVGTLLLSWVWDSWCKIFVSRRGGFALESGPRATFGKKHTGLKFFKNGSAAGSRA